MSEKPTGQERTEYVEVRRLLVNVLREPRARRRLIEDVAEQLRTARDRREATEALRAGRLDPR